MTTAQQFRSAVAQPNDGIEIAGVEWPTYKVLALVLGFLVLVVVGTVTTSAGPAVLAGAGAATVVWLGLGIFHRER